VCGGSTIIFEEYNQSFLDAFVEKRPHPSSIINYNANEVKQMTKETGLEENRNIT
jgi:hypothetical protein